MLCACEHHPASGTSRGSAGRTASSFSSSSGRCPLLLQKAVEFSPFVPAKTLKTCALIGLHLMAAEGESGSSSSQSRDVGDMWRHGCPKRPDWDSDGESWSESGGLSSSDFREHSVESLALHVIGLNWSGEKVIFSWWTGNLRGWP